MTEQYDDSLMPWQELVRTARLQGFDPLVDEIERLHRIMDACAEELKGTMEYGGVLGALRRREMPD